MESRTQNTNCLYLEFVTSVSSIQKASTDIPLVSGSMFQALSAFCGPISMEPRDTSTMP